MIICYKSNNNESALFHKPHMGIQDPLIQINIKNVTVSLLEGVVTDKQGKQARAIYAVLSQMHGQLNIDTWLNIDILIDICRYTHWSAYTQLFFCFVIREGPQKRKLQYQ